MAIKYTIKEKEKELPTLEFLEKGTVIEFTNGCKGLVIDNFGIKSAYVSYGKSILLLDSFDISNTLINQAMIGNYKKVLGKLSEIIIEK